MIDNARPFAMWVPRLALALAALLSAAGSADGAGATAGCRDLSFPVYFAHGAAAVSGPAGQALAEAARQIAGCPLREVVLTPEAALAERNAPGPALADERLQAVATALAAAGVDRRLIRAAPDGSGGPQLPLPPQVTVEVRVQDGGAAPAQAPGRHLAAAHSGSAHA